MDELALKHASAILGYKNYVIEQAMEGVATSPKDRFRHVLIITQWAKGFGLSPALKRGACARSVNAISLKIYQFNYFYIIL